MKTRIDPIILKHTSRAAAHFALAAKKLAQKKAGS